MGYVYSQLVKAQFENLASDPASNPDGLVYLNTTSNVVKWYANSSWRTAVDTDTVQSLSGKTFTDDVVFSSTGAITVPVGTDAQLPGAPTVGMIRYNTDNAEFEGYADGDWGGIGGGGLAPVVASAAVNPAKAGSHYLTNSTGGGFTITLPASPELGDVIRVSDSEDGWGSNNVTVNGNGKNINADATLVLDVTGQWVQFMYDGAKWVTDDPIDGGLPGGGAGGTGSGGINYIVNSDFEEDVANWVVSGLPTISIESGAPLRDNQSMKISLTAADQSNADYVQSDAFGLDAADNNRILKLSFDFQTSAAYVAGDMEVVIWDETGSVVILPSQTSLPQGNGTFEATFVTSDSTSYRLRIRGTASGTTAAARDIVIDNVKVGPETAIPAAPVSDWESYTPTTQGFGTIAASSMEWKRVGDSMFIRGSFDSGTSTGVEAQIGLPSGHTVGGVSLDSEVCGQVIRDAATGTDFHALCTSGDTYFNIGRWNNGGSLIATAPFNGNSFLSSGERGSFSVQVPIAEWAGSGVSLSSARVEYAFNSNTANAADSTSFGYGPGGVDFGSYTGVTTDKTVRFQTPIQPSDVISLEFSPDSGVTWTSGPGYNGLLQDAEIQNGTLYGWRLDNVGGSATDVKVIFYNYRLSNGATYGSAGATWAGAAGGNNRWRVRKSSPNAPAGIQLATSAVPGLVLPNKWGRKGLLANATSVAVMSDLTFSGLQVGATYRVNFFFRGVWTSSSTAEMQCNINDGATLIQEATMLIDANAGTATESMGGSFIYVATDSTLTFDAVKAGTNYFFQGEASGTRSNVTVEKLNNYVAL